MELCLRFGKTRAELRRDMTYREFAQWAVWNARSPIGDERCYDMGHALSRVTAAQIASKPNTKFHLEDFLPFAHRPNVSEGEAALLAWARTYGTPEP